MGAGDESNNEDLSTTIQPPYSTLKMRLARLHVEDHDLLAVVRRLDRVLAHLEPRQRRQQDLLLVSTGGVFQSWATLELGRGVRSAESMGGDAILSRHTPPARQGTGSGNR